MSRETKKKEEEREREREMKEKEGKEIREEKNQQGYQLSHILRICCAVLSHSVVSDSATPWTVARQAPLFTRILQARILEWVAMPSPRFCP